MRAPNSLSPDHRDPATLDRRHELRREPEEIEKLMRHSQAGFTVVWRERSLVRIGERGTRASLLRYEEISELLDERTTSTMVLLGFHEEQPRFAFDVSHLEESVTSPAVARRGEFVDLRQVAAQLDGVDGNLLAYARAMATWHRRHRYCGTCGAVTESRDAGHVRVCTNEECGAQGFPRTDSAVIMLVHDSSRCLLGRQSSWPPGMFSTLAGFVEPGESLEHAVAREVFEEVGLRVDDVEYHSSQPWPFPTSIMLGFWARATSTELRIDSTEIEEARWFEAEALHQAMARREVRLPPRMAISRRLIDDWLRERS